MSNISLVFNEDCMITMSRYPDNFFDLAICDIPYGINVGEMAFLKEIKANVKQKNGNRISARKHKKIHSFKKWDLEPPDQTYFNELKRVCKEQIIFGIEYVNWDGLKKGRIKWQKGVAQGMSFKDYELAYCSLIDYELELPLLWSGMMQAKSLTEPMTMQGNKKLNEKRIHPCHKPIMLYDKLLLEFAKPGFKIYDSHLGGGSNRISCDKYKCDFVGSEIEGEYFEDEEKRWFEYKRQLSIF